MQQHHIPSTCLDVLVSEWRAGDAAAGRRLMMALSHRLDRYYRAKVDSSTTDDLRQEALLRIAYSIASFHGESSFWTFSRTIAHHVLCDHFRKRGTARGRAEASRCSLDELPVHVEPSVETDHEAHMLADALRTLEHEHTELFEYIEIVGLRCIEGLTFPEIAVVIGFRGPPSTLRTRYGRAVTVLRPLLGKACFQVATWIK